jgi:hypothetical protein
LLLPSPDSLEKPESALLELDEVKSTPDDAVGVTTEIDDAAALSDLQ